MTRRQQWTVCLGSFVLAALGAPQAFSLVVREWNGPYGGRAAAAGEHAAASPDPGEPSSLSFAGEVASASAARGG